MKCAVRICGNRFLCEFASPSTSRWKKKAYSGLSQQSAKLFFDSTLPKTGELKLFANNFHRWGRLGQPAIQNGCVTQTLINILIWYIMYTFVFFLHSRCASQTTTKTQCAPRGRLTKSLWSYSWRRQTTVTPPAPHPLPWTRPQQTVRFLIVISKRRALGSRNAIPRRQASAAPAFASYRGMRMLRIYMTGST